MQHANSMGLKWERAQTWDHVLARFSMPALEKLYNISSKVKAARLCQIHIVFQVNILSIPEVISFGINRVGSLNCTPLKSIFKILIIALIGAPMHPSVKIQKNALDKVTGRFGTCIPRRLK